MAQLNIKQGLFRIWILLALGCWGVGGYFAYEANYIVSEASREIKNLKIEYKNLPFSLANKQRFDTRLNEEREDYIYWDGRLETSLWVMSIPLGALVLYFLGVWIVRGFVGNLNANDPTPPRPSLWKKWSENRTAGQVKFATAFFKVVGSVIALLVLFIVTAAISKLTAD